MYMIALVKQVYGVNEGVIHVNCKRVWIHIFRSVHCKNRRSLTVMSLTIKLCVDIVYDTPTYWCSVHIVLYNM